MDIIFHLCFTEYDNIHHPLRSRSLHISLKLYANRYLHICFVDDRYFLCICILLSYEKRYSYKEAYLWLSHKLFTCSTPIIKKKKTYFQASIIFPAQIYWVMKLFPIIAIAWKVAHICFRWRTAITDRSIILFAFCNIHNIILWEAKVSLYRD